MIWSASASSRLRVPSLNGITCPPLPSSRSPVHPSKYRVNACYRDDHVGDQAALGHRRDRLQVRERRVAEVDPVGARAAVADRVAAQLATRGFHGGVGLPGGHPEALSNELEVMDKSLHRL